MDYVEIEAARDLPGLRLVLTPGVPGPWGESAKAILEVKGIPYTPVRQPPEGEKAALIEWTGQSAAPVAMYEAERPRAGWAEILFLAERLAPTPRLVPEDPSERALMLGLAFEICGEQGLGWSRRLGLLPRGADLGTMPFRYGIEESPPVDDGALRVNEILGLLATQLEHRRAAGSEFFVGDALSAVDLYWAAFSNMLVPMPPEASPMPDFIRPIYDAANKPEIEAPAPLLIEHRDRIYRHVIGLPQDF